MIFMDYLSLLPKFYFASPSSTLSFISPGSQLILDSMMTGIAGTLQVKDNTSDTISASDVANKIVFSQGYLNTLSSTAYPGSLTTFISGTLDPAGTDSIVLNDGDILNVSSGGLGIAVSVAASSTATIIGAPVFGSAIVLDASDSILHLGISTKLSQSVTGAGTLFLENDLALAADVALPDVVNMNGFNMTFDGGNYSTNVLFKVDSALTAANMNLSLAGDINLSGDWTVGDNGYGNFFINGNGHALNLGAGGSISFGGASGHLSNIFVTGFSSSTGFSGSATIYVEEAVVIELAGSYVRSDGNFVFQGAGSKIITHANTFEINGAHSMDVDGVNLFYEENNPVLGVGSLFLATGGASINYPNGGAIVRSISNKNLVTSAANVTLQDNFYLSSDATMHFVNPTPGNPYTITVDGQGFFVQFPASGSSLVVIDDSCTVIFTNVIIKDFNYSLISTTNSVVGHFVFGNNCRVELGKDLYVPGGIANYSDYLMCSGNATIDAQGHLITLNSSLALINFNLLQSSTITIKNARLLLNDSANMIMGGSNDTWIFDDVEVMLRNNGWTFGTGSLNVVNEFKLSASPGNTSALVNFEFSSTGTMTILANAQCYVDLGVKFKYNPDPANNLDLYGSKRHLQFAENSSKMILNGCSLETTDTGLALDRGTLIIKDKVEIIATTSPGAEFEIAENVDVRLSAGANLSIDGPMTYKE